jgi:hypothetical protein
MPPASVQPQALLYSGQGLLRWGETSYMRRFAGSETSPLRLDRVQFLGPAVVTRAGSQAGSQPLWTVVDGCRRPFPSQLER